MEEKVEDFKIRLNQMHKEKLANIAKEMEKDFDKFKELKEEDYQKVIL
jgi:hypothetical protein